MTEAMKDDVMGCLYARQPEMTLVNVKFFRGDCDMIDSGDLREQVHSASMQKKVAAAAGSAAAPKTARPKVDVREFVKTL